MLKLKVCDMSLVNIQSQFEIKSNLKRGAIIKEIKIYNCSQIPSPLNEMSHKLVF